MHCLVQDRETCISVVALAAAALRKHGRRERVKVLLGEGEDALSDLNEFSCVQHTLLHQIVGCVDTKHPMAFISSCFFGCACLASPLLLPCHGGSLPAKPCVQDTAFCRLLCLPWPRDWVLQGHSSCVSELAGDKRQKLQK